MKTLKGLFAITLMSSMTLAYAQSPDWIWAKSAGSNGGEAYVSASHTVDNLGNVYIAGSYTGSITFGSTTLNNNSVNAYDADIFIVKYDPSGNVIWAKCAGGNQYDSGKSIAVDETGNVYITGMFTSNSIAFGNSVLTNTDATSQNGYNANHVFIAKYDSAGNALWAKDAGGGAYDLPNEIRPDNAGNIYVTGQFIYPVTFGSTTLVPSSDGGSNVFIVKYDASGNVIWARSEYAFDTHMSTDISGNLYIAGTFQSPSITIGSTVLINNGSVNGAYDIFIAKYDAGGNVVWAKSAGGTDGDMVNAVATDQTGNMYITGEFYSPTINFGGIVLTAAGGGDLFIAKYDSSGNIIWAKSAGGTNLDAPGTINSDGAGNIYVAGIFLSPSITFGNSTLNNTGGQGEYEIFIVKYDPSGNVSWTKSLSLAGGSTYEYDVSLSITTNVSGELYLTGNWLNSTVNFGNIALTGNGNSIDIFIAKLGATVGINENENKNSVSVYPNPFFNTAIVNIESKEKKFTALFELFDMTGNKVKVLEVNNTDSFEINRDNLSEGIYLYQITLNGSHYSTGKLVVQ